MISYPLLKQSIRSNYKIWLIFAVILTIYIAMIIGMYDPQITNKVEELLSLLPKELLSAFGFDMQDQSLTGFVSSYLFGFLLLLFPMIHTILAANRLMASGIDKGSMVYLIATPNARWKIAYTQAVYLAGSTGVLFAWTAAVGVSVCEWLFPGMLRVGTFLDLCLGAYALHFAIGGISFLASCAASDMKHSLTYGAGIPVLFYLVHMLANMKGNLEILQFATIFTLFDTEKILLADTIGYIYMGILAVSGMILYLTGILIFRKRDLSI